MTSCWADLQVRLSSIDQPKHDFQHMQVNQCLRAQKDCSLETQARQQTHQTLDPPSRAVKAPIKNHSLSYPLLSLRES